MKNLYIIRHAKSSWGDPGASDHDRVLNDRGLRDAPVMAAEFKERFGSGHTIFCSTAQRARETASYFIKELGVDGVTYDQSLYLCSAGNLLNFIKEIDSNIDSAMIFGHNPGWTSAVELFTGKYIGNMPTCGIAKIQFDVDWEHVEFELGELVDFIYPKGI